MRSDRARLYRAAENASSLFQRNGFAGTAHPGLLFERYPAVFEPGTSSIARRTYFYAKELVHHYAEAGRGDAGRRLQALNQRLAILAETEWPFTTREPLAMGLGNPHLIENGLQLDPDSGAAYVPASTVKGLVRSGARVLGEDAAAVRLLGPSHESELARGSVALFHALPAHWPVLGVDIVTRHHDPERLPTQTIPSDADEPNPVHYLVVEPGATFLFRARALVRLSPDWIEDVRRWLAEALEVLGAGGKTAVGYGRMSFVDKRSE